MKHRIVLPAIEPTNTAACLDSMSGETRSRCIVIDNTTHGAVFDACATSNGAAILLQYRNTGVAASWNEGCRLAFATGADFVTLCSASMRFKGAAWCTDCDEYERKCGDGGQTLCDIADFCSEHDQWLWGFESLNGWHLFTLGRKTWETVGEFDEQFWPAYFEDNDYIHRMRLAGILEPAGAGDRSARKIPWIPTLKYECAGDALAIKHAGVKVDLEDLRQKYVDKWGGPPGEETPRVMAPYPGYQGDMEYPRR